MSTTEVQVHGHLINNLLEQGQLLLACLGNDRFRLCRPFAIHYDLNLQRYKVLYICGNYSSILSRLFRRFRDLEIRRAFTTFQLMTILEEARERALG